MSRSRRGHKRNLMQPATNSNPQMPKGQVQVSEEHFSGPLPRPDIMKGYDDIVPGAAERILKMAEEESQHRHKLETTLLSQDHEQTIKSQRNALFIAIMGLAVIPLTIYIASNLIVEILGSVVGGIPVLGIIFSLIVKVMKDKDNDDE